LLLFIANMECHIYWEVVMNFYLYKMSEYIVIKMCLNEQGYWWTRALFNQSIYPKLKPTHTFRACIKPPLLY